MAELNNILFLDIETVRQSRDFEELDERWKALWEKKAKFIAKDEQTANDVYERASIYAEFGKIVAICVGVIYKDTEGKNAIKLKSIHGHDEKVILNEFAALVQKNFSGAQHYLCGHNGKEFDFPYIARRMLVHGIPLPVPLQMAGKKPWEIKHLDTMELWKFGDYKNFTSLDLMAAIFGIPTPKDVIDGSMVGDVYWVEEDLEKIATYCKKDVSTLINVYLRLVGKEIIPDQQVSG